MRGSLSKAVRLSPAEWRGLTAAYLYLLAAGWKLFIVKKNLNRWDADQGGDGPSGELTREQQEYLDRRVRWVDIASRHPIRWARCLQRSLGLCLWMEKYGLRPTLKIGVQRQGNELLAHAWVEYSGQVINEDPAVLQGFMVLKSADENDSGVPGMKELHWI